MILFLNFSTLYYILLGFVSLVFINLFWIIIFICVIYIFKIYFSLQTTLKWFSKVFPPNTFLVKLGWILYSVTIINAYGYTICEVLFLTFMFSLILPLILTVGRISQPTFQDIIKLLKTKYWRTEINFIVLVGGTDSWIYQWNRIKKGADTDHLNMLNSHLTKIQKQLNGEKINFLINGTGIFLGKN